MDGAEVKPTFPNARYYVQREHWNAALHPTERDRASFFPHDFLPLERQGRLEFLDGEGEIFPGIHVRLMHGHTTALQCPVISDDHHSVFYCADLMPTISHIAHAWIMAYDLRPVVTLEEKKKILREAVDRNWILFFEHDPNTEAVTLKETEKGIVMDAAWTID